MGYDRNHLLKLKKCDFFVLYKKYSCSHALSFSSHVSYRIAYTCTCSFKFCTNKSSRINLHIFYLKKVVNGADTAKIAL